MAIQKTVIDAGQAYNRALGEVLTLAKGIAMNGVPAEWPHWERDAAHMVIRDYLRRLPQIEIYAGDRSACEHADWLLTQAGSTACPQVPPGPPVRPYCWGADERADTR